jgi:hypothetical protein
MIAPTNNTVFDMNTENEKSGKNDQRVEQTTTKNVIENGILIVEQYDRQRQTNMQNTARFSNAG